MKTKIQWFIRIVIAIILVQTLYFKFTAHPDSVYIFSKVNLEPTGRIGIGVLELIGSILILTRRYTWAGALLIMGIIGGAIGMHLTTLGIAVNGDKGGLFYTAVLVFVMSFYVLINQRKTIPIIGKKL